MLSIRRTYMQTEAPAASVREDGGTLETPGRDEEPTLPQAPSAVNSTSILLRSNIESALSGGISSLLIIFRYCQTSPDICQQRLLREGPVGVPKTGGGRKEGRGRPLPLQRQ